jgi:integrase
MPRHSGIPSYRQHKRSGKAVVTLSDGHGARYDVQLGEYNSPESRERYARVIAEWEAAGRRRTVAAAARAGLSVNEMAERFLERAERYYRRPDGTATSEITNFKLSIRVLRQLYGMTPAAAFSPLKLKAVRQKMIDDDLCRGVINQRIGRIKSMFKWAVQEEIIPESVYRALQCVRGIPRGRGEARETEPIGPVPEAYVVAVQQHVVPTVAAMIEIQWLTGMRPGEVCAMRAIDIETSGSVWLYRPAQHKTAWRGRSRVVALGPKAQAIVRKYLTTDTQAYLFSPKRAVEEHRAALRAERKTPVQPSQLCRAKAKRQIEPGDRYTNETYARAIARGCVKADSDARDKATKSAAAAGVDQPEEGAVFVPHWHPNQLRHLHATEVRRQFGLEAAQVALGHSQAQVTEIYAERNLGLAVQVAAKIG